MKIEDKFTPSSKMKLILKASEKILTSINDFYEKANGKFNKYIDADDLLSIFYYIAAKCQVYTMYSHCALIDKFSTNNILNSISGYYLTTLQASLDYLDETFINEIELRKGAEHND